jgi:L-malate glycosyltransferase
VITLKVLHLNAGVETGGGMVHILQLLHHFDQADMILGLFEKGLIYDKAIEKGIKVVLFKQRSRMDFKLLKKIIHLIDEENLEIVHTHGPRANFYGCFLKRRRPRIKWIITVHSNPRHDFLGKGLIGKAFTFLHLWALKKPDHYLAISSRFKDFLISEGIEEKKITTIYNGIDFSTNPNCSTISREALNVLEDDFLMIMVARLCPVKGHHIVFQALKELIMIHPNIKLLVVGDGFLEEELKKFVQKIGIADSVIFLGHRDDVDSLYKISDIKVLSSFSESFPLVLLEAARAKKPVITTDVGGVRDLIISKDLGWIVPIKSHDHLKQAIEEAINYKKMGKLKEMGMNLYNRASTHFTIDHFQESVLHAYKNLK